MSWPDVKLTPQTNKQTDFGDVCVIFTNNMYLLLQHRPQGANNRRLLVNTCHYYIFIIFTVSLHGKSGLTVLYQD